MVVSVSIHRVHVQYIHKRYCKIGGGPVLAIYRYRTELIEYPELPVGKLIGKYDIQYRADLNCQQTLNIRFSIHPV